MYNPIELPTLQEIEQIEKQRQKAKESLEIIGDKVKCQNCNSLQPIRPALTTNNNNSSRIYQLQTRIKHAERYYRFGGNYSDCTKEKEELVELLKEHDKKDILRRIPLYSSSITGYKLVCSKCYDEAYYSIYIKNKKKE